jgi:hypothetical protein
MDYDGTLIARLVPNPDQRSQVQDFALLKVDAKNLPAISLEAREELSWGHD